MKERGARWRPDSERDTESCWGQFVRPQRQPSDYFPPKLTMTLTTAGGQQMSYSPGISASAYCEPINQQTTFRPFGGHQIYHKTKYVKQIKKSKGAFWCMCISLGGTASKAAKQQTKYICIYGYTLDLISQNIKLVFISFFLQTVRE